MFSPVRLAGPSRRASLRRSVAVAVAIVAAVALAVPATAVPTPLAPIKAGGTLDSTFSSDGLATAGLAYASGRAVAVDPDGRIVVVGFIQATTNDIVVARFLADGTPDPTFSGDGLVTTDLGADESAWAVAVQPDGRIIVAGDMRSGGNDDFLVARYTTAGSLDPTFSGDGVEITGFGPGRNELANAIAIQKDGRIVTSGYTYDATDDYDFAVARYTTSGSLDAGFGTGGLVMTDFGSMDDEGFAVAIQKDGRIVAAGYTEAGGEYRIGLARYNVDGSLDPGFGIDGLVAASNPVGFESTGYAVAIGKDGKIVVAGGTWSSGGSDFAVARFRSNGAQDTAFGESGWAIIDLLYQDQGSAVAIQKDGRIVAAGYAWSAGADAVVIRLTSSGKPDATFGTGGAVTADFGSESYAFGTAIQPDGRIVIGGGVGTDLAAMRYLGK